MMEINVSMMVQDKKVSFNDNLKNSLNIQTPESLIWEPNTEPLPTASTINSGEIPGCPSIGDTTPAAVIAATVADPIITRNKAVTTQAKSKGGICHLVLNEEI